MGEVQVAIKELASLHATTYYFSDEIYAGGIDALKKDHPVFFARSFTNMEAEDHKKTAELFTSSMVKSALDVVENFGTKEQSARLQEFEKHRASILEHCTEAKGNFNMIIHGDYWYNNMMYR